MTLIDPESLFENVNEKSKLEKERDKILADFQAASQKQDELSKMISALNVKKADLAAHKRMLDNKIREIEAKEQQDQRDRDNLIKLQAEAEEIQKYHKRLEELIGEMYSWGQAREYQKEDIVSCIKCYMEGKQGFLNANDMSLGKTFEAICILQALKQIKPKARILWLTKLSLTISTPKEIKRWWPEASLITSAVAKNPAQRKIVLDMLNMGADFLVANYEFIKTTPELDNYHFDFLVIDEAHKLKGGANQGKPTDIWKATKKLKQNVDFCIFLTGTPMVNKSSEMWAYLNIFDEMRFPNLRQFERSLQIYKGYQMDHNANEKAAQTLQGILRGQMIRRTADEVGLELPEIVSETRELQMHPDQREAYDQMRTQFFIWLEEQTDEPLTSTSILAQLIRLRQINVWPDNIVFNQRDENNNIIKTQTLNIKQSSKIDEAMDIIDNCGDQIVVFSTFNEPLEEIRRRCGTSEYNLRCQVLNGTNSWNVGQIESDFQAGKIDVLCLNSAVGEGLNLQKDKSKWPGGARFGIMLDKWYSPARNDQCLRRIIRPGSSDKGVFYYLENERSVDAWINELNAIKQADFDSITSSKQLRPRDWKAYLKDKI